MTLSDVEIITTSPDIVKVRSTKRIKKKRLLVYVTRTSLPSYLLIESLNEIGYSVELLESSLLLASKRETKCDLFWCGCDTDDVIPTKRQNRIPAMKFACRKGPMCQLVNLMQDLFPEEFTFLPRSWPLPSNYSAFCHYVFSGMKSNRNKSSDKVYILKPDEGAQGDGIYLFKSPADITQGTLTKNCVVQEYVNNPLLLDGYKFDLRLYVLISKLNPIEAYICKEGLGRFCTEKYEKPATKNLGKAYMHLTNYSLNKFSKDFVQTDDDCNGSKRTLTAVMNQMLILGHDTDKLWALIENIVMKTLLCIVPLIKVEQLNMDPSINESIDYFHLLGFDILIDDQLKPFLLEVNGFPSMRTDYEAYNEFFEKQTFPSPVDEKVKKIVLKGAMHILFKKTCNEDYSCLLDAQNAEENKMFYIFEECRKLFMVFLKKSPNRKTSLLGTTGFRSFVRNCKILEIVPDVTNADLDLLFINIGQSSELSSSKHLSFMSFYKLLTQLSAKRSPDDDTYIALNSLIKECYLSNVLTHARTIC